MSGTRRLLIAALLPALAVLPAAAATVVNQKGRTFRPGEINIARGETVTFTNEDSYIHQVYVSGLFESDEKAPGEKLTEGFLRSGTFEVKCHIHPKMKLVVRVN